MYSLLLLACAQLFLCQVRRLWLLLHFSVLVASSVGFCSLPMRQPCLPLSTCLSISEDTTEWWQPSIRWSLLGNSLSFHKTELTWENPGDGKPTPLQEQQVQLASQECLYKSRINTISSNAIKIKSWSVKYSDWTTEWNLHLKHIKKKKSRMLHIFSTDNTTTVKWNWQRISCWVSAIGMLHNWRILKFLYIDNFWSDESTQSLIYRMCMYKNQPLSISDHKIHLA